MVKILMRFLDRLYFRFRQAFSARLPRVYGFCEARKKIIKFVIAGCIAGGSDLVFLYIFHGLLHWTILIATSVAFILSFVVSFTLQKFWTFRDYRQDKMMGQLLMYLLTGFIALNLNGFFMHLLVNEFRVWYLLSQFVVNLFLGLSNFLVYKFIIFKHRHEADCQKITT